MRTASHASNTTAFRLVGRSVSGAFNESQSSFLGLLAACAIALAAPAYAELPAFPGAEGAAQFVTGGRGGDVYKVTNLNDSGSGSLRQGISSAPAEGRTIVFDVAGTIHLNSSLNVTAKSNLTIAGQTAPGGGITLYGNRMRISESDNVVVQFLRVRPGAATDNADGIWVRESSNIMIDHVTTAWSTDESLSVTNSSSNVTVQWSTMFQGLLGHSFGSLLNGGNYTFHHNLYAHNRSRNPRPQHLNTLLTLDWVNNVVYNPGDRFGYSGDHFDMNMVGNLGIKGPNSQNSEPANYMMRPDNTQSRFYVEGNAMDIVRDGYVNGVHLEGHDLFRSGDDYTLVGERFNAGGTLHPVRTHTAEQAYIHTLSRAGAVNYRDAHDRDMIRSIMNQQPGHISHESEWNANFIPVLPAGTPIVDTSGDGIPDGWAMDQGLDPSQQYHQALAPSGYTYLEEHIHSLTPFAYAPVDTVPHAISTAFGRGADAQVNENGGSSATSSGDGLADSIGLQWGGPAGSTNQAMILRFDLSQIMPGSLDDARLELTAAEDIPGSRTFKVWGLEHDATGWDWDEESVEYANAPGLTFDGNSGTLGIDPRYTANGQLAATNNHPLPVPDDLLVLGELTIDSTAEGEVVSFDGLNLPVFLNLAAFFEADDMAGLATIIIQQINSAPAASFHSKEGDPLLAPRLVVDALLNEVSVPVLSGDLNNDGIVDAADYTVWRDGLGSEFSPDDFDDWKDNFGATQSAESAVAVVGLGSSAHVPEPSSAAIALLSLAFALILSRSRRYWGKTQSISRAANVAGAETYAHSR